MARGSNTKPRNASASDASDATDAVDTVDTAEATVDTAGTENTDTVTANEPDQASATDTNTEATDTNTEATDTPDPVAEQAAIEAKAKAADEALAKFRETVDSAITGDDETEGADETTGELPSASLSKINGAYSALPDAKAKNEARSWLAAQMQDFMNQAPATGDMSLVVRASSYMKIANQLTASKTPKTSTPVDPTEAFLDQMAALTVAYQLVYAKPPTGVKENWEELLTQRVENNSELIHAYGDWLDAEVPEGQDGPDEPEVPTFVKNAYKLAAGKATRGSKAKAKASTPRATPEGPRRSIGKHIAEYFENQDKGHFATIGEIAKWKSGEYPEGDASAGAVSQRAFPQENRKVNLPEGLVPDEQNGRKGIRKAA